MHRDLSGIVTEEARRQQRGAFRLSPLCILSGQVGNTGSVQEPRRFTCAPHRSGRVGMGRDQWRKAVLHIRSASRKQPRPHRVDAGLALTRNALLDDNVRGGGGNSDAGREVGLRWPSDLAARVE